MCILPQFNIIPCALLELIFKLEINSEKSGPRYPTYMISCLCYSTENGVINSDYRVNEINFV